MKYCAGFGGPYSVSEASSRIFMFPICSEVSMLIGVIFVVESAFGSAMFNHIQHTWFAKCTYLILWADVLQA